MGQVSWPCCSSGGGGGGGGGLTALVITGATVLPNQTTAQLFVVANSSGGPYNVTLPDATLNPGLIVTIKNYGTPTNNITVVTQGGQTIDGNANDVLSTQNQAREYVAIGGQWYRG